MLRALRAICKRKHQRKLVAASGHSMAQTMRMKSDHARISRMNLESSSWKRAFTSAQVSFLSQKRTTAQHKASTILTSRVLLNQADLAFSTCLLGPEFSPRKRSMCSSKRGDDDSEDHETTTQLEDAQVNENVFESVEATPEILDCEQDQGEQGQRPNAGDGADESGEDGPFELSNPFEFVPSEVFIQASNVRPFMLHATGPILMNPAVHDSLMDAKKNNLSHRHFGIFWAKGDEASSSSIKSTDKLHKIGVCVYISSFFDNVPESMRNSALVHATKRIRIVEQTGAVPLKARVEVIKDDPVSQEDMMRIQAMTGQVLAGLKELFQAMPNPGVPDPMMQKQLDAINTLRTTETTAHLPLALLIPNVPTNVLQEILEQTNPKERLQRMLELVAEAKMILETQQEIRQEMNEKMQKAQREVWLKEQMKVIRKELGIDVDTREQDSEKFKERISKAVIPEETRKLIESEINRFQMLESQSHEFSMVRNYVDWLTLMPWGKFSKENFDLDHASKVLERDHHGLKDVKERILEFIAVGKLNKGVQGKIILLVGPPGVGKTSIGKSIAKALHRKFHRFSVGGVSDVSEIKGHRRTYVGAMPGKLVQALKATKVANPLIMLDEIDKLGRGSHNGDPAGALLEVLDPEQNSKFLDHYLDVPFDLSKVLFVCTANGTDTIPQPLLDRMEVIQLSGYVQDEKVEIARKHLLPNVRKESGIPAGALRFQTSAIQHLIRWYCREAGVRNLRKRIEQIFRKVALKLGRDASTKVTITNKNLKDYVGMPVFDKDRIYEETPAGVVMGLSVNSMYGGSALFVEAIKVSNTEGPSFTITGQFGKVMSESSSIAFSHAKFVLETLQPGNEYFKKAAIHLHIPDGAVPKDGPSAGITMVTALISLALGKPVRPHLSMTGEVTLNGKVLVVGGIKEKLLAAKSASATDMIMPEACRHQYEELSDEIKQGINVHFVDQYEQVRKIAFDYEDLVQNDSTTLLESSESVTYEQDEVLEEGEVPEEDHIDDSEDVSVDDAAANEKIAEAAEVPVEDTKES